MLVDDHAMVRNGVRMMLGLADDIVVVAEAEEAGAALALAGEHAPDVTLLDIAMPGLGGMELLKLLRRRYPQQAVLMLSMYGEEMYAARAFKNGASGYLTKNSQAELLIEAVRLAASGRKFVSPALLARFADGLGASGKLDADPHAALTDRELEILRLIVAGETLVRIGAILNLSASTVTTHRARMLDKLGVRSNAELARYASLHGLVG